MRKFHKKHFVLLAALVAVLSFAGCNLFNPTEDVYIKSNDAAALTYEGYIRFRNNEYTQAAQYFSMAIAADSTYSEAWYGLAKSKLNQQQLNTFELLKYVDVNDNSKSGKLPLLDMDDATALKYEVGIDTIVTFLKNFIYRDTTGMLDGKVSYKTIAESYMLLNMVNTMLTMRKTTASIQGCTTINPATGKYECDFGSVLNSLKGGKIDKTMDALHEVFSSCESNPDNLASIAGGAIPVFGTMFTDEGQSTTASVMCGALADLTTDTGDSTQNEQALSSVIAVSGYSEFKDDDGDGCFDEEILDGVDNDGDGEVDEDLRDVNDHFVLDIEKITKNQLSGKTEKKDQLIYASFAPIEKYERLDIDMNGITGATDKDEWEYVYPKYEDRVKNWNFHLKFAEKLSYNPKRYPMEEYLKYKREVAADHDGSKYDLNTRKTVIGGCWERYDEKMFEQWKMQWRE